ncbi:hypothetical protein YN1_7950 [Nanoarchaeota archaeon]
MKIFNLSFINKNKKDKERLNKLRVLLSALYDTGYTKIRKTLFMKLIFLIDYYLDEKLSREPKVFGYNFYIYKYGVFTSKVLIDLENLNISYEKNKDGVYIKIPVPSYDDRKLIEEYIELYNKFKKIIEKYVKPFEEDPDGLSNYILEKLLGVRPGQKIFYYYTNVEELIEENHIS